MENNVNVRHGHDYLLVRILFYVGYMKFKGLSEKAASMIARIESKKIHPCQPNKKLDKWKNLIQNYEIYGEKIYRKRIQ